MDDPVVWGGIWLATAATLGVGEMMTAGSFWLVPFALAAIPAAIVSFLGFPIAVGWLLFLVCSIGAFLAMRPLAKRLDIDVPHIPGIGANRLVGHDAVIIEDIPWGSEVHGMVRAGGETWSALSVGDVGLAVGTEVRIVEVRGTRVVVEPVPPVGLDPFA